MNHRPEPRPSTESDMPLFIFVVVVVSAGSLHWLTAILAMFLRRGRLFRASFNEMLASIQRMPRSLGDPAASWSEPWRSQLPGPVLYWLSAVLVVAAIVAIVVLYFRWRRPPLEAPDRRRRLGVDAQPRLAEERELSPLLARKSEPNRLVLGRWSRRWLLMTEPSMVSRRRGVRGAVAVFGPSQSGKTTGLVLSVNEWRGPAIVSSVKTDLMRQTIEARRKAGDVKVFDPQGITDLPSATWSPLRRARTRDGALAAAHQLCAAAGDEGSTDKFWRSQAEQLLAAMMWIAANVEGYSMRHVVEWVTTLARLLADNDDPEIARNAKEVRGWLTGQWNADPKTSASIYTTARSAIWPWTDSGVQRSAEGCEITLDWLLAGDNTLYLVAPLGGEQRLGKVFSVMMQDLVADAFDKSNRTGPIDPGLLLVLDEAANTALPDCPSGRRR